MKTTIKTVLSVAMALASFSVMGVASASEKNNNPVLSLDSAYTVANAAQKQCIADGYNVSVAVVDRHGNLLVQLRNPQAGPHTVGSSLGKAFTSASMGQPTANIANMIAENPSLEGLRDMDSRMVILGGGLPISIGDYRVGGIGVGGAPGGHLDAACAEAGIKALGEK